MSYGTNAPQGLIPSRTQINATWNGAYSQYPIASGYATALFHGDPVTLLADGTIGIGVAGAICVGVFQGVSYTNATGQYITSFTWPAAQATLTLIPALAQVIDDPNVIFEIQTNSGVGLTKANINQNANFVAGAGNPLTGLSGYMLDQASVGNGAGLNLKIKALGDYPLNAPGLDTPLAAAAQPYNTALVTINNHYYKAGTAGI
jgi:hypothetical protein